MPHTARHDARDEPNVLFVYGSLRADVGHSARGLLQKHRAATRCYATMPGLLYRISWYPGMIDAPARCENPPVVIGELVGPVTAALLADLDRYEDAATPAAASAKDDKNLSDAPEPTPCLYSRVIRTATRADGRRVAAWVYLYSRPLPPGATPIAGGDWVNA